MLEKGTADRGARLRRWEELRLNGAMKGEGEAKTHCHEKEQRSPQSQEKSKAVDLGTWTKSGRGCWAGCIYCCPSNSSSSFQETPDHFSYEFQSIGITRLLLLSALHSPFSTQKAGLFFLKHKCGHVTPQLCSNSSVVYSEFNPKY